MHVTARRERLRRYLSADTCVRPASVFDPVSSRIAYALGFELGMLGGSIASHTILGAPDLAVMTLTELASQCYRITRASDLSLLVDADNAYGNALSARRTVQELEAAGVAGMTIEDTVLPQRYGHQGEEELIPVDEMIGKLRASVEARQDAATVILARTHAINATSFEEAVARVGAYAETGVDGVFILGAKEIPQIEAIREVTSLPFMLGATAPAITNEMLAPLGVRIVLRGHGTFNASVKAIHDSLKHQAEGGAPAEVSDTFASAEVMRMATGGEPYAAWQESYL